MTTSAGNSSIGDYLLTPGSDRRERPSAFHARQKFLQENKPMKPPEFERAALLHEVIGHATHQLKAPIEGIEIIGDRVDCWSKSRQVSLGFCYSPGGYYENETNGSDGPSLGEFHITVGSGSWSVWVVTKPEARKGVIARTLAKVLRRRGA